MMVNGIALLYLPAMLHDHGMTDVEIGIIVSIPFLVRMIGMPIGAFLADRVSDRAIVMIWSAAVSLAMAVALLFAQSFWPIVLFYGIQSLLYAPFVRIAEAILVSGVRRWGVDYGFLRLWGSVAFVVATLLGGWLLDLFGGASGLAQDDAAAAARRAKLWSAMDKLNQKYDRKDTVRIGPLPRHKSDFMGAKIAFNRIPKKEEFKE